MTWIEPENLVRRVAELERVIRALATVSTNGGGGGSSNGNGRPTDLTLYQLRSDRGVSNGYAILDASGTVPDVEIPAGIMRVGGLANYQLRSEKGAANGYAPLDSNAKLPNAQVPSLLIIHQPTMGNEILRLETAMPGGNITEHVYQNTVSTTDANLTTVQSIAIPSATVLTIEARVVANKTSGTDAGSYVRLGTYQNNGGTVTLVGDVDSLPGGEEIYTAETPVSSAWETTFTISGTNVLVQVKGSAGTTVAWQATMRTWSSS